MEDNYNSTNQTVELTTDEGCLSPVVSTAGKVAKITAYILILVVAVSGNILTLHVVRKTKHLQSKVNFLIINMAASDLFIPFFVFPKKIADILLDTEGKWLLTGLAGEVSCKLFSFVQDVATAVSIQTVVLIAVERLVAVVFPLRVKMFTSRLRVALIVSTWILGAALHAPYFYTFKLIDFGTEVDCVPSWEPAFEEPKTGKIYITFLFVFLNLIPFSLLSFVYIVIVWTLAKERNSLKGATHGGVRVHGRMNKNVLKMALTIVGAFAVCWAPVNVHAFILIFVWNWEAPRCELASFRFAAVFLAYANTAVNPCVYFAFVEHFRRSLRKAITESILHSSLWGVGSRLNARRETFDLTSISGDRPSDVESKSVEGVLVLSSRSLSHSRIADEVFWLPRPRKFKMRECFPFN